MIDRFHHKKLVIGVRAHNYLVTSSNYNGTSVSYRNFDNVQSQRTAVSSLRLLCISLARCQNVRQETLNGTFLTGPSRCAAFPSIKQQDCISRKIDKMQQRSPTIYLDSLKCGAGLCTQQPTQHAELHFAAMHRYLSCPSLYSLCRNLMSPAAVFFRNLAVRAQARKRTKIILLIKDIEVPHPNAQTEVAKLTRIIALFPPESKKRLVSGNEDAEKELAELANKFSNIISDKNLTISRRIASHE